MTSIYFRPSHSIEVLINIPRIQKNMGAQKYVVCKGYYGLGGNIAVLLCAKRVSEILDRKLLVDWRENRNYGLSDSDIFQDLFSSDEILSFDPSFGEGSVWPEYWKPFIGRTQPYSSDFPLTTVRSSDIEEIPRDELNKFDLIVITRDDKYWHSHEYLEEFSQISRCLSPNSEILKTIDNFEKENFSDHTVGIHFRHGNGEKTVVPPDINWFFEKIESIYGSKKDFRVFLCTDCSAVVSRFEEKYPGLVIHTEKFYPPLGSGGMHYAKGDEAKMSSAIEAIIDIWLLSRCSRLIGSKSFFSRLAVILGQSRNLIEHFIWNPIHRSHKPLEGHIEISEDDEILRLFSSNLIPIDGIYFTESGNEKELYYLFTKIATFSDRNPLDIEIVRSGLLRNRLY